MMCYKSDRFDSVIPDLFEIAFKCNLSVYISITATDSLYVGREDGRWISLIKYLGLHPRYFKSDHFYNICVV